MNQADLDYAANCARIPPSLAVALNCGTGSSALKALVNAFDISGLPASAITGATGKFNITDSFPLNYITNSTPTDNMIFFYTPGHNGTYFTPSQNKFPERKY